MLNPSLFETYLNQSRSFGFADPNSSFLPQTQSNYEDIAGLEPLPLQKMLQQIGRPFTKLYQQIEQHKGTPWRHTPKEIKQLLAPDSKRNEQVLRRAQAVERTRQSWDPIEAQWKERMNRATAAPRSKPSQASLDAFSGVSRTISQNAFDTLNKQGITFGILDDISDYLQPGQIDIIKKGVVEQLKQGVQPSEIVRRASGGSINTGRGHIRGAVENAIEDYQKNYQSKPGASSILDRYLQQMKQTEPPLIVPGVSSQFEGV